jgi:two-component system, NarL family, sensor histidine kinase UhpB
MPINTVDFRAVRALPRARREKGALLKRRALVVGTGSRNLRKFLRYFPSFRGRVNAVTAYFVAAAAAILIPGLLLGGWLVLTSAMAQRDQIADGAENETREVMAIIDREMASAQNILTTLANSHFLQTGEFEAFHKQASDVSRHFNSHIILREFGTARHIVNTFRPLGSELPDSMATERREIEDQIMRSQQTVISNMFFSRLRKQLIVAVVAPVWRKGAPAYSLTIAIPVTKFADILGLHQNPSEWTVSMIDRNGAIMARSPQHQKHVGSKESVSPYLHEAAIFGSHRGLDFDGTPFTWSWRKSDVTGWIVSIGVPEAVLNAPVRRAMITYAVTGGMLLFVTLALSFFVGSRISESIGALGIDRKPTREELEVLFDSTINGIMIVDNAGIVVLANSQIERMFGHRCDELIRGPVDKLFSEPLKIDAKWPLTTTVTNRALFGYRKNGDRFPAEIGFTPLIIGADRFVRVVVIDISARKLAEERLASAIAERDDLRRRLMQAHEQERLRLAHELHDQTGQSLAAAMLDLSAMEPMISQGGRARLNALQEHLEKIGKTLHRVAWELRPASIDELGLASALADYVAEWSAQIGIEADFYCGDARLDALGDDIRTTLYRLLQEGLTNIAKHAAAASSVSVIVDRTGDTLRLTIEDDGRGFDPAAQNGTRRGAGLGFAGMRERLALIGGELEIESSPGRGTTVYARIALARERLVA